MDGVRRADDSAPPADADLMPSAAPLDEQQQRQLEVATVQHQLSDNPQQYELHVRLLRLLQSLHETDELRAARQRMAELFPLTADLWSQWLDDDKQRIDSHDDQLRLLALHQRACRDYLVPQLWLQYVEFAEQLLYSADEQQWGDEEAERGRADSGVTKARAVYEEAARAMGAHRLDGERLWRAYRKFELAVLTRMLQLKQQRDNDRDGREEEKEDADEEDEDESKEEEESEVEQQEVAAVMQQVDRVKALYRRSLAQPNNGLDQAYNEYKQFVQQQGYEAEDDITATFKQAKSQRDARTPYEKALPVAVPSSSPPTGILTADELTAWFAYIHFEQQQSAKRRPARVAVLYERALTSAFLHADMWGAYTLLLEETGSRQEKREEEKRAEGDAEEDRADAVAELLSVYQRAVRNIPHTGSLWSGWIRTLERRDSSSTELMSAYQRAMEALAPRGGDDQASVCLSMADSLRRLLRAQPQRDNRSRSRSPMRSSTADHKSASSSTSSSHLSLPPSRPPSKRSVISAAHDTIRPILQQAVQALRYHNPALSHPAQHSELSASLFLAYHSLERHDARDTAAARAVLEQWAELAGGESRVWLEWARAETEAGEVSLARHVFKRGLERLQLDWSAESVCWEWLRFEREHGSVEECHAAWLRCEKLFGQFNAARAALQQQHQQQQQAYVQTTAATGDAQSHDGRRDEQRSKKRTKRDDTPHNEQDGTAATEAEDGRSGSRNKKQKTKPEKKQRAERRDTAAQESIAMEEEKQSASTGAAAKISAPAESSQQQQQSDAAAQHTIQPAAPAASATVESKEPTTEPAGQPASTGHLEQSVQHPTRTLLVTNLSWVTKRDTLRSLFAPFGAVESVELHDDAAPHKQYAHVVYASKDAVKAAVAATHSRDVDGSVVSVEGVAHRHKREKAEQKLAAHRNLTVFIRQLPTRDDVEARLRQHFADCGSIVRVRVSRGSKAEARVVAWIEWADKEAYERARQKDGSTMDGDEQPIRVVADRAPPPRQAGARNEGDEQGAAADRQRSRLQLMPRAVQAQEREKRNEDEPIAVESIEVAGADESKTSEVRDGTDGLSATEASPLSNSDFRALLMRRK